MFHIISRKRRIELPRSLAQSDQASPHYCCLAGLRSDRRHCVSSFSQMPSVMPRASEFWRWIPRHLGSGKHAASASGKQWAGAGGALLLSYASATSSNIRGLICGTSTQPVARSLSVERNFFGSNWRTGD